MDSVISLLGRRRRERRSAEATQPSAAPQRPPSGAIIGTCDLCHLSVHESDAFHGDGRVMHCSCLAQYNKERGWDACRHFMYQRLAFPFARALGTPRVRPFIDQFLDPGTHYAPAFTLLSNLEMMLLQSAVAPDDQAEAVRALAECKGQLRRYLRPLPK
jgi:hypothetical protein